MLYVVSFGPLVPPWKRSFKVQVVKSFHSKCWGMFYFCSPTLSWLSIYDRLFESLILWVLATIVTVVPLQWVPKQGIKSPNGPALLRTFYYWACLCQIKLKQLLWFTNCLSSIWELKENDTVQCRVKLSGNSFWCKRLPTISVTFNQYIDIKA